MSNPYTDEFLEAFRGYWIERYRSTSEYLGIKEGTINSLLKLMFCRISIVEDEPYHLTSSKSSLHHPVCRKIS